MAQIWEYIANYNPTGFYEDNRSKDLKNSYMSSQISAANMKNAREKKIMELQDAWANGDEEALRQIGIYSPETSKKYMENTDEMLNLMRPVAQSVLQASPENREKAYQQFLQFGKKHNVDMSDVSPNYDEGFITTLANSDPQKIRDERVNEMAEQRAQNQFNRALAQMQYQNALANQKAEAERQRRQAILDEALANGKLSQQQYDTYSLQNSGINNYAPEDPVELLKARYFDTNTTQDEREEIQKTINAWNVANTKGSGNEFLQLLALKQSDKFDNLPEDDKNKIEARLDYLSKNPEGEYSRAEAGAAGKKSGEYQGGKNVAEDKGYFWEGKQKYVMPDTEAEYEYLKENKKELANNRVTARAARTVLEDITAMKRIAQDNPNFVASWASLASAIPGTSMKDFAARINSIKGNSAVDQLLRIKQSGAGLGQIPQQQLNMLADMLGNLDRAQSLPELLDVINRFEREYTEVVKEAEESNDKIYSKIRMPSSTLKVGAVFDGYKYLGGDPNDETSWEKE